MPPEGSPPLPEQLSPQQAGEVVGEASRLVTAEAARRGHGRAAYTSLVLRSLKQAYYSDRNIGHAGLGSPAYAHFTSPIRRYPDLLVHRALKASLEKRRRPFSLAPEAGLHLSVCERTAGEAEAARGQAAPEMRGGPARDQAAAVFDARVETQAERRGRRLGPLAIGLEEGLEGGSLGPRPSEPLALVHELDFFANALLAPLVEARYPIGEEQVERGVGAVRDAVQLALDVVHLGLDRLDRFGAADHGQSQLVQIAFQIVGCARHCPHSASLRREDLSLCASWRRWLPASR